MRTYLREAEIIYRRKGKLPEDVRRRVGSSADAAPVLNEIIGSRLTESFVVLALSSRNEIIGYHEVARGAVSYCPVTPADVFRYPILAGAEAIIIAHNHPSGDSNPSSEDVALTEKLARAAQLLGIRILDHIILAGEGCYTSFLDSGLLGAPRH